MEKEELNKQLLYAAKQYSLDRFIKTAEKLLKAGADVNVQDEMGKTPLMIVSRRFNNEDALLFLLSNGADDKKTDILGNKAENHAKDRCKGVVDKMFRDLKLHLIANRNVEEELNDMKNEMLKMKDMLEALRYAPGGNEYMKAEKDYEELKKN